MIYLDNNATTPILPEVVDAMLPFLTEHYGNPSAGYDLAQPVRQALDTARQQVADLISATPEEIVFTGCGSEANNSALASAVALQSDRKKIVVGATEHSAIGKSAEQLVGAENVLTAPVHPDGRLNLDAFEDILDQHADDIAIVSVMWANNETGVIHPIEEISRLTAGAGLPFHTDAVQAAGKIPIAVNAHPIQFLSLAAHKFHGPKGVGALFIKSATRFRNLLVGGGQEDGRRAGTENVAGIVGMGAAAQAMKERMADGILHRVELLRDHFESLLRDGIDGFALNGSREHRVPNTINFCIKGVPAEAMLFRLDEAGVCCSSGSACKTGNPAPSHVLTAMGISETDAKSSLRLSLSSLSTAEEIETAAREVIKAAEKVRAERPTGGVIFNT